MNAHDHWLDTTPEDEDDSANARRNRRAGLAERALDRAEDGDTDDDCYEGDYV